MQCQQTNKNSQETVVSKISRIVFRKHKRRFMRTQKVLDKPEAISQEEFSQPRYYSTMRHINEL